MNNKYALAARISAQMVVEIMQDRHNWSQNEALSTLSKCRLFETLSDYRTKLWMDNPHDIADLFDKELAGEELTLKDFLGY
jgi:hypothetical protein